MRPATTPTTPLPSSTATPSGASVWLVLWHAARAMETVARRNVESQGLCLTDFAVLEVLLHKGPLPVNTIGRRVLLTSGSITAAVDRLERRGLVERRAHPSDRRARIVELTTTGTDLIRSAFTDHAHALDEAVQGLSPDERRTLTGLLLQLERSVRFDQQGRTP